MPDTHLATSRLWLRVPASWISHLALFLALTTAACDSLRANEREKQSTLAPWESARIGKEPAMEYLTKRSGMLLVGADGMAQGESRKNIVSIPVLRGTPPDTLVGGAAVAIDERGYWLTAAHCLEDQPMLLLTSDGHSLRWWAARVVWNGFEHGEEDGVDLALLHARGEPFAVMHFGPSPPRAGPVLCRGSGLKSDPFSAGSLTDFDEGRDVAGCVTIYHDAPVAQGDSGGAAMNADGTLAGINIAGKPRFLGFGSPRTTALCPDPVFLQNLIELDVRQRAKPAPPSP